VTVKPETNKRIVFKSGIEEYEIGVIPAGGQNEPSSTLGESEECKKAQKKEAKRKTSEVRKRRKPILRPRVTMLVWRPK